MNSNSVQGSSPNRGILKKEKEKEVIQKSPATFSLFINTSTITTNNTNSTNNSNSNNNGNGNGKTNSYGGNSLNTSPFNVANSSRASPRVRDKVPSSLTRLTRSTSSTLPRKYEREKERTIRRNRSDIISDSSGTDEDGDLVHEIDTDDDVAIMKKSIDQTQIDRECRAALTRARGLIIPLDVSGNDLYPSPPLHSPLYPSPKSTHPLHHSSPPSPPLPYMLL